MPAGRKPSGKTCKIRSCGEEVRARDLCARHYGRWQRTGDAELVLSAGGPASVPAAIVGRLSKRQRDAWCRLGYIDAPIDPATGRRRWTPQEVRVALIMARLSAAGIALPVAAALARSTVVTGKRTHDLGGGLVLRVEEPAADRKVTVY